MYEDLTQRQIDILEYIKVFSKEHGYPPSVREICVGVGFKSTSSVHNHLNTLTEKNYIRRTSLKTRAINLVEREESSTFRDTEMVDLPLLGKITAGDPIHAEQEVLQTIPLPLEFVGTGDHFLLKVKGTSMIDAGICDGDTIIVKVQNTANDGDIVVAFLIDNEEATVKTFYQDQDMVVLKPQNPAFEPRTLKDTEVRVLGKVSGLLRSFN